MSRKLQSLLLALVLLGGFLAGFVAVPEASAARPGPCFLVCCIDEPNICAHCCTGRPCDLPCG